MKKTVCIVNYNTTDLTLAAVQSIRRHGGDDYRVVIFDNSDEIPFVRPENAGEVLLVDNTQGQVIDFDGELAKYPNRNVSIGCAAGCTFGSNKHMWTIDWLIWNVEEPFVLMDSDILVRESIEEFFDTSQAAIGKVVYDHGRIPRLHPMLCWLNAPMLRKAGIHYFNPERTWALKESRDDRTNWYDTGASFLEDITAADMPWMDVDVEERHIHHLKSGSWRNNGSTAERWLKEYAHLWKPTPAEEGRKNVAICAIARNENLYLKEWADYHLKMGVEHIYLYDNGHGNEERPSDVLDDYRVTIIDWRDVGGRAQCGAYDDCYRNHGGEYAWIGFIDIDEFVMTEKKVSLPKVLSAHKQADIVAFTWKVIGDSGLTMYDPRPVVERFTKEAVDWEEEKCYIKSFVRGGISNLSFHTDPHVPHQPKGLKTVNPDGGEAPQCSIGTGSRKVAWLNHYVTKTAEEYAVKVLRGWPDILTERVKTKLARSRVTFFRLNKRTPEKEEILQEMFGKLPKYIQDMEHLQKKNARWGYTRLVAEDGYLIRSKKTGKVYQEITVPNPEQFEVIPLPTSATGKPKRAKRA